MWNLDCLDFMVEVYRIYRGKTRVLYTVLVMQPFDFLEWLFLERNKRAFVLPFP